LQFTRFESAPAHEGPCVYYGEQSEENREVDSKCYETVAQPGEAVAGGAARRSRSADRGGCARGLRQAALFQKMLAGGDGPTATLAVFSVRSDLAVAMRTFHRYGGPHTLSFVKDTLGRTRFRITEGQRSGGHCPVGGCESIGVVRKVKLPTLKSQTARFKDGAPSLLLRATNLFTSIGLLASLRLRYGDLGERRRGPLPCYLWCRIGTWLGPR